MTGAPILAGWQTALDAGELRFPRCDTCERWNWYPLPGCRACGSGSFTWRRVSPTGTLYSWTRIHRAFGGAVAAPLPYVTGVVDIDDAPGVRLVCLGVQDTANPSIGGRVALALDRRDDILRWTFTMQA